MDGRIRPQGWPRVIELLHGQDRHTGLVIGGICSPTPKAFTVGLRCSMQGLRKQHEKGKGQKTCDAGLPRPLRHDAERGFRNWRWLLHGGNAQYFPPQLFSTRLVLIHLTADSSPTRFAS